MAVNDDIISSRHIKLANKSSECSRLYEFLADSLEQLPVTKEFRHDIKLVSEELLANIINHGYASETDETIDVEFAVYAGSVRITFTDSARAFNPLKRSDSGLLNDLSEGGMGILLVKSLTDEQHYQRESSHNVFTVTKNYNT